MTELKLNLPLDSSSTLLPLPGGADAITERQSLGVSR